jgi:hypothetical protein
MKTVSHLRRAGTLGRAASLAELATHAGTTLLLLLLLLRGLIDAHTELVVFAGLARALAAVAAAALLLLHLGHNGRSRLDGGSNGARLLQCNHGL